MKKDLVCQKDLDRSFPIDFFQFLFYYIAVVGSPLYHLCQAWDIVNPRSTHEMQIEHGLNRSECMEYRENEGICT
jgi:hypothetical protein